MTKLTVSHTKQTELFTLLMSVDYDYSRLTIAEHELNNENLIIYIEDKQDFKNTMDELLMVEIPVKQFASIIAENNLNSYEGEKMHPVKKFMYKTQIVINEPIKWYEEDAALIEQQWAREAVLKTLIEQLVN